MYEKGQSLPTPDLPSVGVVVVTHNRPKLMRLAVESILAQDYEGDIDILVVYDRSEPDESMIADDAGRRVRVATNERTPGLAGARNTGILNLEHDYIAFCDDDDTWHREKLRAQVDRFVADPDVHFVTTAMRVRYDDQTVTRTAGRSTVTVEELARSRMAMLHSSSFVMRRSAMLGSASDSGFGLVDETMPRSMGEDWDLLLRAARRHPITHIDRPLIDVLWGATSYFNDAWHDKNAAAVWLLERHPEMRQDSKALASMYGKLAFGYAALGQRREALRHAMRAVRANWREPRVAFALLAVLGVPARIITVALNKRGHGI